MLSRVIAQSAHPMPMMRSNSAIRMPPSKCTASDRSRSVTARCAHESRSPLHESGRLAEAEQVYRDALKNCGNDALLLYNFGVLLDDMDRKVEAMAAYQLALRGDPALADCHYNLALLYEELERPKDAIRHMAQYRRLVAGKPSH